MDVGDGFSIDTDVMSVLNSTEITSTASLREALTQIEGRYRTHLEAQVVDTIMQAYASHRRITGLWLHMKDWTQGLEQFTDTAADRIRLAYADIPDASSSQMTTPQSSAAGTPTSTTAPNNPATSLGSELGQLFTGFTQGLQQIPEMAAQIPSSFQNLGQPLQQAFQPIQDLIQEITHALGNDGKAENLYTDEFNSHADDNNHSYPADQRDEISDIDSDPHNNDEAKENRNPASASTQITSAAADANNPETAGNNNSESSPNSKDASVTESSENQSIEETSLLYSPIGDDIIIN